MLCERALTRVTKGSVLSEKQTIQNWIADSWAEMQAARLMTLHAAWTIDQHGTSKARTEIAGIKFFGAKVLHDVIDRAIQIHGSLGVSNDLPLEIERITSGASNEVFVVRRGDQEWVLRRPSPNSPAPPATMGREFLVLSALEGTSVPHPTPYALCEDDAVLGAPFYLMQRIDGFAPRVPLPPPFDADEGARHGLGTALVDAIADLSQVDWRARDLEHFGKPDNYLERQVDRWLGQLERARNRELPDVDAVSEWLREHTPVMGEPGILHGDVHLGNVMFHHGGPPARIAAIVDWEQSTIGDPLVDLGWLLALWDEPGDEPIRGMSEMRVAQEPGFPTRAELSARYAERTGRSLERLGWYEVLALFKLGCVLEGAYARYAGGASTNPAHARLEHMVPNLFRSASAIVAKGGKPR
jgi:aminoglycoside phosphotransferase (APT) family kinase protein